MLIYIAHHRKKNFNVQYTHDRPGLYGGGPKNNVEYSTYLLDIRKSQETV